LHILSYLEIKFMQGLIPVEIWWRRVEERYGGRSAMELARWYIELRRRQRMKIN